MLKIIASLSFAFLLLGCETTKPLNKVIRADSIALDKIPLSLEKNEDVFAKLKYELEFRGFMVIENSNSLKLELPGSIFMKRSSAKLNNQIKIALRYLSLSLENHPDLKIKITGHTDSTGRFETNEALSILRGVAVADYLAMHGVRNKIHVVGYGEAKPIADNMTSLGQAKNRRVEIYLIK